MTDRMKSPDQKKFRRDRLRTMLVGLVALALLLLAVAAYKTYRVYQSDLPSFEQLHNIEPSLKTKIYDRNGILIQEFFSENRALTPFDQMPPDLVNMLLASEDRKFYDHWGIDVRRVLVVAFSNLLSWDIKAGASTITQQLARMLFLNREQTFDRKFKEALTAVKLERTYSKQEILEMYLNQYYFGSGAYGVAAAAHNFFGKNVAELTISDDAVLIGMLKAPNSNSPFRYPDRALKARNRVLYSYYTYGGLNRAQYDSLKDEPLVVTPPSENVGDAPYFTEEIRQYIFDRYGESMLYSGGLKVFTSLDVGLQRAAEAAVARKVDSLRARIERMYTLGNPDYTELLPDTVDAQGRPIRAYKHVQGAFVAIDNATGDVLALVGGRSFEATKYNRATQGRLQPGSAFKPFVYTAAVDNGFRTSDLIDDLPIVLDIPGASQWRPHNFDDKFMGPITLRDGIRLSRNLVAIRLLLRIKPEQAIFYARRMGITTPLQANPSLALGTSEVIPIELVSAFSVFPNKGIHIPYRMIHKIVDRYGSVIEDNTAIQKEEVLSEQTSYIMVNLMQSVVDAGTGRGVRSRGFTRPAAGKTGTSNNFCDNWFIGFTPQITAGAWVGFDVKTSLGRSQDGAKNGVPIWTEFMMAAHDTLPILDFEEPEGIVHADVCLESGELATDRCTDVRTEIFTADSQPTQRCRLHPSSGRYSAGAAARRPAAPDVDTSEDRTHF
ncbi:MAG TPA: PBP1A family penicillin-binding protein [candidate division Zixibacteria bacterium]|nr:PBP1A family penicillin-binding protein [candidate division Zixibacteria bacterium]